MLWRGNTRARSCEEGCVIAFADTAPSPVPTPTPTQPLSPVLLGYTTQFLVGFSHPKRKNNWEMNTSTFIVHYYFGRCLRLSLKLTSFKLSFRVNVCSLPNFGHFFATMTFHRTKPKIGVSVTEWKFASQMLSFLLIQFSHREL